MTAKRRAQGYARNPGQDQLAKWKAEVAKHNRQQRQRRVKRTQDAPRVAGPGMMRRPPQPKEQP
jgi:hypothetical protein